jgi:predicted cupin superfamily sugar epimerase
MNRTARYWIDKLNLTRHPEGGHYKEVYRSKEIINKKSLPSRYTSFRTFSTSVYYLLQSHEFSAFHRLKSDEIWHFYEGSPITLFLILPNGNLKKIILGRYPENNELLQFIIPRGCWFAAKVYSPGSYSLVGCTVSPGFDFDDFELGNFEKLVKLFPQHTAIIQKLTTF